MDPLWIGIAFAFGFLVKQIKLPPLLGFLMAGFALNALGVENSPALNELAQAGILLLLFSIGLKLNVRSLLSPVIWAGTTIQIVITVLVFSLLLFASGMTGFFRMLDLPPEKIILIAFALSFSSTVFVIKILEERGASSTLYGKLAVGILVMQDIIAVLFLTFSTGKIPNVWALTLLPLIFIPKLINKATLFPLLNRSGHGELLVLLGILIPLGGAYIFEIVGLKPDLGALVFGVLLSGHPKAKELSKVMLSFKDLFLVGFFLTIGLTGLPTIETMVIALLLNLVLPVKSIIYYMMMVKFRLSARSSFLSTLSLTNYSEFGLIVGATALLNGWLPAEWMVVFALTLSLSFILASPLNLFSNQLYIKWSHTLHKFESQNLIPDERPIQLGDAGIVIFGMRKIGTTIYDLLTEKGLNHIVGIDVVPEKVQGHRDQGRNVLNGDITDSDFWNRVYSNGKVKMVVMTISSHYSIMQALLEMKQSGIDVKTAALHRYEDEAVELREMGVDITYDLYSEAGLGYGQHIYDIYRQQKS